MDEASDRKVGFGAIRYHYESLVSTNSAAFEKAAGGAPEGTVVTADGQTGGRGRKERRWISVPGAGLYASVALRPKLDPELMGLIPLAAGVAAVRAVREISNLSAMLKWPNDVFVLGRKVAGVLTEARYGSEGASTVVVGAGFNLRFPEGALDGPLLHRAASLADFGADVDADELLDSWCAALESEYVKLGAGRGSEVVAAAEELASEMMGRRVSFEGPEGRLDGKALGIEPTGELAVELDSGERTIIRAGDVALMEEPPEGPENER